MDKEELKIKADALNDNLKGKTIREVIPGEAPEGDTQYSVVLKFKGGLRCEVTTDYKDGLLVFPR